MSSTVDIGAARVHLVVDADDWDSTIQQALGGAQRFGTAAEQAFDKASGGARRSATRLLDYVSAITKTDTQFDKLLRTAARAGVEEPLLKAAVDTWKRYQQEITNTTIAMEEAKRIDAAFTQQRSAASQQNFNSLLGVGEKNAADQARRRADAEAALLPILQQQEDELQRQLVLANQINAARDEARVALAQRDFNEVIGVNTNDGAEQARRRADAESALLPILQQQEQEYAQQLDLANRINAARDESRVQLAQREFNQLLGVQDNGAEQRIRRQADATSALTKIVLAEAAAEDEAYGQNTDVSRFITQLENLKNTAGKTHYELLELKAAQLGISAQAGPLIRGIKEQNLAMGNATLSTKQYQFALRGLPAQFTDIFTSLAAGQNPLLVLLQQGGQIKDMFGGIVPALKAVGSGILAFVNPLTIVGALLGTVAIAALQAENRLEDFSTAGIRSGGLAGTGLELQNIANKLNDIDNVSLANADEAVQRLAGSGVLVGQALTDAQEATARWSTATGDKVDEVAAKFESLARDPLAALMKLNEAEHFLTEAQYERIRALVEEGQTQEAVTEAVRLYADTVNNRTGEVIDNLGNMSRAWMEVKDSISDAWQEVVEFADFLAGAGMQQKTQSWWKRVGPLAGIGAVQSLYSAESPMEQRANQVANGSTTATGRAAAALTREQQLALQDLDRQLKTSGTKTQQYESAVKSLNATLKNVSDTALAARKITRDATGGYSGAGYDALITSLKAKNKEAKGPGAPSGRDATQAIKDQMAIELAMLQTQSRQIESQYSQRTIDVETYYDKLMTLAEQERDVTKRSNNEQIAALAGKKDAERQIGTLKAANARADEQFAQKKIELDTAEAAAARQRAAAYRDYVRGLEAANENIDRQMQSMVDRVSMGSREFEVQQAINQVYLDQTNKLRDIQNAQDDLQITTKEAEERRAALFVKTQEGIAKVTQGYIDLAAAEANWLNGAKQSWADYVEGTENVAAQVKEMWDYAFKGIEDAGVDALSGNLKSWEDYFGELHEMILRFIVKQQLTKWFEQIGSAANASGRKDDGSLWGSIIGAAASIFGGATKNAHGNAFSGSGLSAYRNQIVSSPTVFPFAKGGVPNVGLMGEVRGRSEGIFPLARMGNGDLGVRVVESGKGAVNIYQSNHYEGKQDRTTEDQHAKKVGRETSRAMSRN